jgi:hypothetical protein
MSRHRELTPAQIAWARTWQWRESQKRERERVRENEAAAVAATVAVTAAKAAVAATVAVTAATVAVTAAKAAVAETEAAAAATAKEEAAAIEAAALVVGDRKIAVITCIYGDYDDLMSPPTDPLCDYICFTDNKDISSDVWRVIVEEPSYAGDLEYSNMVNTGLFKAAAPRLFETLREYDICVHIDANVRIHDWAVFRKCIAMGGAGLIGLIVSLHFDARATIKAEAEVSRSLPKYENTDLEGQIKGYYDDGYDDSLGLIWNGFVIHMNPQDPSMDRFYDLFQKEILGYVIDKKAPFHVQGQLSLPYVIWKTNTPFKILASGPFHGYINNKRLMQYCGHKARVTKPTDGNIPAAE